MMGNTRTFPEVVLSVLLFYLTGHPFGFQKETPHYYTRRKIFGYRAIYVCPIAEISP
jgi:hypothetical protein